MKVVNLNYGLAETLNWTGYVPTIAFENDNERQSKVFAGHVADYVASGIDVYSSYLIGQFGSLDIYSFNKNPV